MSLVRIAHVNNSPGGSVDQKLLAQAQAARRLGLPLDFYIMNWAGGDSDQENLHLRASRRGDRGRGLVRLIRANRRRAAQIEPILRQAHKVVIRFPKVPFNNVLLLLRHGSRIVTEHHTDEVSEILVRRTLRRRLLAAAVRLVSGVILRRASGHIAVTDEIRRVQLRKSKVPRAVTITNGVDAAALQRTGFRPFDGRRVALLAVSSEFQAWYAVDRILDGLRSYPGPVAIDLTLAGRVSPGAAGAAERISAAGIHSVRMPGTSSGARLDDLFRSATVAVGSLGLHRNRMKQACPLKVREYMARGIPFIYAYDDPDIPADAPFALKLPADDTPIDIAQVVEFARRVSALPGLSELMRRYAIEHLDWGIKVRQMYDFVSALP